MAYAALDSLASDLDWTLDHKLCINCLKVSGIDGCVILQNKQHIRRLHQNIVFLSNFLSDFPREADKLQERLTNAANRARTVIGKWLAISHI